MMLFFQPFIHVYRKIQQINPVLTGFFPYPAIFRLNHSALCLFMLLIMSTGPGASIAGSNYFMEKEIALALQAHEPDENIIWLETDEKRPVLAVRSPSNSVDLQGGIIILADLYQPPDWPVVIHGLRKYLPDYGWETLSVQLPIPEDNTSNPDLEELYTLTKGRIEAAISYFNNNNINNISLVAINQSANFSLKYAASLPVDSDKIQSIVSIRAYDTDWLASSNMLKFISLPVLDVFPEHDDDGILQSAKKRLSAAGFSAKRNTRPRKVRLSSKVQKLAINKTGNLRYRQKMINGANYRFYKLESTLFKAIRGWLGVYASGSRVTVN